MDHIVFPLGDRQTLFSYAKGKLKHLTTLPLFPLTHRVEISDNFLVTFAACKSALIVQTWFQTGRVGLPEIIELPKNVIGECILVTNEDELFVGGKSNRPWLGKINLQDKTRSWTSVLSDLDLENANEKAIDALSFSFGGDFGPRLIAYDNLMLPLYAWIIDKTEQCWKKPRRVEIEPEYTYEHIISAYATYDYVYLITRGVNHGKTMQFLRKFDKNIKQSTLLFSETLRNSWSNESDDGNMYQSGEEWQQVMATDTDIVLLAAGNAGLGKYDPASSEVKYFGHARQSARFIELVDLDSSIAVAFENSNESILNRWEIEVFSVNSTSIYTSLHFDSHESKYTD